MGALLQDVWGGLAGVWESLRVWLRREFGVLLLLSALFVAVHLLFGFLLKRLKRAWVTGLERHRPEGSSSGEAVKRAETLAGFFGWTGRLLIWFVFLLLVFNRLGVNIGPILTSAGIVGVVVGFGAQELFRDLIAGFFILVEDQVRVGDVAVINGTGGLVERVALRTITLRDFAGVVHIFQNGKIASLANMTKGWSAMLFDVPVAYKERPDRVMEVMRRVGEEMASDSGFKDRILEPVEVFGVETFGESGFVVRARVKTVPMEQWNVGREYRRRLKEAFDREGIEIPVPHMKVYWGAALDVRSGSLGGGS